MIGIFFLGGEVMVGQVIKYSLLSAAVVAGNDITATRQSGGGNKIPL